MPVEVNGKGRVCHEDEDRVFKTMADERHDLKQLKLIFESLYMHFAVYNN